MNIASDLPISASRSERTHRWALAAGASRSWRHFRAEWTRLPTVAWRRWAATLVVGFLLTALLMWGVAVLGQRLADAGMREWDRALLLRWANDGFLSFHSAIWWEGLGSSAMLIPVVVCSTLFALWRDRVLMALTILATYLLHDPIVLLGWTLWERARPTLIAGGIAAPPLGSFPSGHVVQAIAVYGFFAFLWMRASRSGLERLLAGLLLAALVAVIGLARLRLGVHWPSDLVAAVPIGTAWLAVSITALRRAEAAGGR